MFKFSRLFTLAGGALATLIMACFLFVTFAGADTASLWLDPSNLNIQNQANLSAVPPAWNGNVDCYQEDNSSCVINTLYGSANTNASIRLTNSKDYAPVISNVDDRQHFIAIPNSSTFITYTTEPVDGFYVYFNYNFLSSVKLINQGLGPYYQVIQPPNGKLADKSGTRLAADYKSISFSENGQWMIVSDPNVAMLRVNLQTFDVLPFTSGFNYTIGLDPSPQTAITNDGHYAVVTSKDFSRFSVYDLQTCGTVPTTITGPVNCQSQDLQTFTTQQVNGFTSVHNLRFISDDTFGLYIRYLDGSTQKVARYILSSGTSTIHQQDYLALGDSYMSGEGAFQYLPGTDTSNSQCHVSAVSYPYLIGQQLNYNAYHSVGCSGATTNDLVNTTYGYSGQVEPHSSKQELIKSSQYPSILSNFQQGYIDQLDFVKQYQPKVVTISIGGNDIGFSSRLQQCLGTGTCYSTYEDRLEFVHEANHAFPKLVNTYTKIRNSGAADARIYVIGYPQIALPGGNCAVNVHMNNDELVFAEQAIDYLDSVIAQAAAKAGVFYIDARDAFFGHRLCEAGPGSVAVNGITVGNDFPDKLNGPIGRESYHPNAFGHLLLENRILAATHNLTSAMPNPDLTATLPTEKDLEILDVPHSGRSMNTTEFDSGISADLAYQQVPLDVSVDGTEHSLAPNAALRAELHSNPLSLGSFNTDTNGNLNAQVTVPTGIPAGYHTLHFYGTDITGQAIDIYKVIYLANTVDDLDGNNILDSTQKCVGVPDSNQDFDQDSIDDSCDGKIDQPPVQTPISVSVATTVSSSTNNLVLSSANNSASQVNNQSSTPSQNTKPIVLAAVTSNSANQIKNDNLNIPAHYYAIAAVAFLSLTTLYYCLKRWLF